MEDRLSDQHIKELELFHQEVKKYKSHMQSLKDKISILIGEPQSTEELSPEAVSPLDHNANIDGINEQTASGNPNETKDEENLDNEKEVDSHKLTPETNEALSGDKSATRTFSISNDIERSSNPEEISFKSLQEKRLRSIKRSSSITSAHNFLRLKKDKNSLSMMLNAYGSMNDGFTLGQSDAKDKGNNYSANELQLEGQVEALQKESLLLKYIANLRIKFQIYTKVPYYKAASIQLPMEFEPLVHPQSHFRQQWNMFVFLFMNASLIICPPITAFEDRGDRFFLFTLTVAFFMIVDSVVNAITSITLDHGLETKVDLVVKDYLKGVFLLELGCLIPFLLSILGHLDGWNVFNDGPRLNPILLLIMNAGCLIKTIETHKYEKYQSGYDIKQAIRRFGIVVNPSLVRSAKVFWVMVNYCHWSACIMFVFGYLQKLPKESWIMKGRYLDMSVSSRYTQAVFMVMSMILCNG
jgi:hypothetical protein